MRFYKLLLGFFVCSIAFSCTDGAGKNGKALETQEGIAAAIDTVTIQQDFMRWWKYENEEINLSSNFIALDAKGGEIDQPAFFTILNSGEYIPLKVDHAQGRDTYRLLKLQPDADPEIGNQMTYIAFDHFEKYKKIGTEFPAFNFEDLEENFYSNETLKGKTIVLKTWFIGCRPCIEEFPQLNNLVEEFGGMDDIVFISLALDSKESLAKFLEKKPFNYKVIPDQSHFIQEVLKIDDYPTHMVIGPDGTYERIPDNLERLIAYLKK
ncbi:TlpA disulfide reductase family protein [Flammeovirgaceae bacterium SG7u.111]|nr:TlpA disulfide reductase family protein [Flammeovirgaceae bacterium SG7u.132]WPO36612.1 TlpA disulfide reductase family protein [Flammeovirgaceae bacterium SG7u.111]